MKRISIVGFDGFGAVSVHLPWHAIPVTEPETHSLPISTYADSLQHFFPLRKRLQSTVTEP